MIWREGLLPQDAPNFGAELSDDLLSYGYSLLLHGLRYTDLGGDAATADRAFEVAAEALEAVVARGPAGAERDFHREARVVLHQVGELQDDLDEATPVLLVGVELHEAHEHLAVVGPQLQRLHVDPGGLGLLPELRRRELRDLV